MKENKIFKYIEGRGWWFKDSSKYWLHVMPLSDRLELAIIDILQRHVEITFDELLQELYTKFTNALTPSRKDVRKILEEYAEKIIRRRRYLWRLKSTVRRDIGRHTQLIKILAELGYSFKYDVWIGRREWGEKVNVKTLFDYVSDKYKDGLTPLGFRKFYLEKIEYIDVLWIEDNIVKYAFEVEYTTAITEAIRRLKILHLAMKERHLPAHLYVLVIPKERNERLIKKIEDLRLTGMVSKDDMNYLRKVFVQELEEFSSRKFINIEKFNELLKDIYENNNEKEKKARILTLDTFLEDLD